MPFESVLREGRVESLLDLCLRAVVKSVNIKPSPPDPNPYLGLMDRQLTRLRPQADTCERIITCQIEEGFHVDKQFVSIFEDTRSTTLERLSLRSCSLKGTEAEILFRHGLKEIELKKMKVNFMKNYLRVLII